MKCTILLCLCSVITWAQDCSTYNRVFGPFPYVQVGYDDHSTGNHTFANEMVGYCSYTGYTECDAVARADSASAVTDTGKLNLPGFVHETAQQDASSTATAAYPSLASASAEGVGAVRECFPSCAFSISLSGPGGSVIFNGGAAKWTAKKTYTNTCAAHKIVVNYCGSAAQDGAPPPINPCGPSPILVDTRNQGFHFTDASKPGGYVSFRFGDKVLKVSWPDWRYENAWLVKLETGVIDGADDLFGNFTAHADGGIKGHPNPNGFLALAWYDKTSQGGNLDGIIDKQDAIWHKLRLWKPKHCHLQPDQLCMALDSELFTLESQGVHSLSLVYQDGSDFNDNHGNQCSFKALVNPDVGEHQHSKDGRWACDFTLAVHK